MHYSMAEQHCLMCNAPVPFIPFKDPLCNPPCEAQLPRPHGLEEGTGKACDCYQCRDWDYNQGESQ